jgi:hypothetical protein
MLERRFIRTARRPICVVKMQRAAEMLPSCFCRTSVRCHKERIDYRTDSESDNTPKPCGH